MCQTGVGRSSCKYVSDMFKIGRKRELVAWHMSWTCFRHNKLEMVEHAFMYACIHPCMFLTRFDHVADMIGHVSDMIWTYFRLVLDMFWQCSGIVLAMSWQCFGKCLAMVCQWFGYVLVMMWQSVGHVLAMCWQCYGTAFSSNVLGIIQT